MKQKFFSMEKVGNEATLNIYGDITSYAYGDGVQAKNIVAQLDEMKDVSKINVFINSYGGEVAEGLAVYNALRRHKAKVRTYCEGFACSIASVIFMAGDERIMRDSSLLMIHNAWTCAQGNADELRKQADDLDKITAASVAAYKTHSNLSEDDIKALMDAEEWISPKEAIGYGFATEIEGADEKPVASQNARSRVFETLKAYNAKAVSETDGEETDETGTSDGEGGEETAPKTDETESETDGEDENAAESAKTAPKSGETDDGEETPDEEKAGENNGKNAAQWFSGFFNAIQKI